MDESKMLSGDQLVTKGATKKVDGQLPEVGLKDVTPNGSWLEQKQIQSALEARKLLIAVQRIEKSGSISHAEWRDDLKLAVVTKKIGGHWQHYGHQIGSYSYLLPEETLFMIETNNLLLKHNDVTVSLQKAYSLCLNKMCIMQYKVYASLGRLGYRVFRHKEPTPDISNIENTNEETIGIAMEKDSDVDLSISMETKQTTQATTELSSNINYSENNKVSENNTTNIKSLRDIPASNQGATEDIVRSNVTNAEDNIYDSKSDTNDALINDNNITKGSEQNEEKSIPMLEVCYNRNSNDIVTVSRMHTDDNANETTVTTYSHENMVSSHQLVVKSTGETSNAETLDVYSVDEFGIIRLLKKDTPMQMDTAVCNVANVDIDSTELADEGSSTNDSCKHYQAELKHYDDKINKLAERKSNSEHRNQTLDTMLDFHKLLTVKVIAPDEKYLPRNIFLHRTEYTINMELIRSQNASSINDETDSTESSTPANGMDSQRLTNSAHYTTFNNTQSRHPMYHRPRYNHRMNFSCMYRMPNFYSPRYHPNTFVRQHYTVYNVNMHRPNNFSNQSKAAIKKYHYDMIVNIAMRFKNGLALPAQVRALQNLLNSYNLRYNTGIYVTPEFNIAGITETEPVRNVEQNVITVDDEPKPKKARLNDDIKIYNDNLLKLKELASKLQMLHDKNLAVSRHRRVFSNAIKTFNRSFNADLYLDSNFVIVDRKTVVIDTSSDSDAVVVKEKEKPKKRKKLRNPYSILKQIKKNVNVGASTSQVPVLRTLTLNVINDSNSVNTTNTNNAKSSTTADDRDMRLLKSFYESRFPGDDDFGRPRLCSQVNAHLDTLLFQMDCSDIWKEFKSWADIKLAILKDIRGTLNLQRQQVETMTNDLYTTESQIQPILGPECTELKSALKKLAIIPTNKEVPVETSLRIHFDVYNRDVHYKKSSPPKPNFRVICYDELAPFPSTEDLVDLQGKYRDGVPLVFAFIGTSASISYLQINSTELPVFIPDNGLGYE